jgi:hypothetical protein
VGLTPEARTRDEALGRSKTEDEIKIGPKEISQVLQEINTAKDEYFDAVLLGCPHPHINEVRELASLLSGRQLRSGIRFWIFISDDVLLLARHLGYAKVIEAAGAEFIERDCIVFFHTKGWGWKTVMTNSAKYANLLPSEPTCLNVIYRDTAGCVALATQN